MKEYGASNILFKLEKDKEISEDDLKKSLDEVQKLTDDFIKKVDVVAYEDLGTEAIRRLEVEDFPLIVVNDIYGNDLLEQGQAEWQRELPSRET